MTEPRSTAARAKAGITYAIIAESNGHKWMNWHGMICCRDCGLLRPPSATE